MTMTPQQRAAKTRAFNRESKRLYEEISKPAHEKVETILNSLLLAHEIRVTWKGKWLLKNRVVGGRLLKIDFGGLGFTVLIDGYKKPRHYSSQFWDLARTK